jgi:MYXO-CTERM domain-containing protein
VTRAATVAAIIVAVASSACAPSGAALVREQRALAAPRKLDLLFAIDNSASMEAAQANLTLNFPQFLQVLAQTPDANGVPGAPDLHLAVVSSDLGVGSEATIENCSINGDAGLFQSMEGPPPVPPCVPGLANGAHFIADDGQGHTNYTGTLADSFACIATRGATGCGFQQPLHAIAHALGADNFAYVQPVPPSGNEGFLRPDAYLGIVVLTHQDDCSARDNGLYDVSVSNRQGTPLGPPTSYRCNHFGHICDGARPRWDSPTGATGAALQTYTHCQSDESGEWEFPVEQLADGIKALKQAWQKQLFVSALIGAPQPYVVDWRAGNVSNDPPWPYVEHSCPSPSATTGAFADPAVRIAQWVAAFGSNGTVGSFCDADYGPVLTDVARAIASNLGAALPDGGTDAGDGSSDGDSDGSGAAGAGGGSGTGGGGGHMGAGGAAGATGSGGGAGASAAGDAGGSSAGGHPQQDAGSVDAGGTTGSSGCSCTVGGEGGSGGASAFSAALAAALCKRRRRNRGP